MNTPFIMRYKRRERLEQTVYADILFCVNFVIDYIILLTVRRFLSLSCRQRRLLLGAAVGGISSFVILLPPLPSGVSMVLSVITACLVVGATFAPMEKKIYIKTAAAFFLISFVYCGAMIAVWLVFSPQNIFIRNSSVYIAMSPISLVITTVICYVILRIIMRITGRNEIKDTSCLIKVEYEGNTISLNGKIDTGNTLKEPFSGEPAIVAAADNFKNIFSLPSFGTDYPETLPTAIRMIPFSSVGGEGLLPSFKSDNIIIKHEGREFRVSAYVALCSGDKIIGGENALVPYELIP